MPLWLALAWDALKALVSGEIASWCKNHKSKQAGREDAQDVPLTKQEELDDIDSLPGR